MRPKARGRYVTFAMVADYPTIKTTVVGLMYSGYQYVNGWDNVGMHLLIIRYIRSCRDYLSSLSKWILM